MSQILEPVKAALLSLIRSFTEGKNREQVSIDIEKADAFLGELVPVFSQLADFRTKMKGLNDLFAKYPEFSALEEYVFDLLMLHFIAADSGHLDENYLESDEWLKIEDDTADRGTEWLNLLIYISEIKEEEKKADLHDFLDEFLLVEDELYQDEFFIYEPVIKNAGLAEASVNDIVEAGKKIDSDELKELFIPLMVYFNTGGSARERYEALGNSRHNTAINLALYGATLAFEGSMK